MVDSCREDNGISNNSKSCGLAYYHDAYDSNHHYNPEFSYISDLGLSSQDDRNGIRIDPTAAPAPAATNSDVDDDTGCSFSGAIFNFVNTIVGAGAIGLGGAIADSGGLFSIIAIISFAILTKLSLDMIVTLSIQQHITVNSSDQVDNNNNNNSDNVDNNNNEDDYDNEYESFERRNSSTGSSVSSGTASQYSLLGPTSPSSIAMPILSYEALGLAAFGPIGRLLVLLSKFVYSFGCLVVYLIVIKDNFSSALRYLLYPSNNQQYSSFSDYNQIDIDNNPSSQLLLLQWIYNFLGHEGLTTCFISTVVVLPLCSLRDMKPLSNFSIISVISMASIVFIVIYLYFTNPDNIREPGGTQYENWFEIRSAGVLQSLGTFVFAFVSHHTVHITYQSLKPSIRTIRTFKKISFYSILLATIISMSIGIFVYLTFWEYKTQSDMFQSYPSTLKIIHFAKILLCITMALTFPFPFFTCRELIIETTTTIATTVVPLLFCCSGKDTNNNSNTTNNNRNDINENGNSSNNYIQGNNKYTNDSSNRGHDDVETNFTSGLVQLREPLLLQEYCDHNFNKTNTTKLEISNFCNNVIVASPVLTTITEEQEEQDQSIIIVTTGTTATTSSSDYNEDIGNWFCLKDIILKRINTHCFSSSSIFLTASRTGDGNDDCDENVSGEIKTSNQLILPLHMALTVTLWSLSTFLAVNAPSLGDVLNFVGCVSGTLIAFILPALFSFKFNGYTHAAAIILIIGGFVGTAGTYFAFQKMLITDCNDYPDISINDTPAAPVSFYSISNIIPF